MTLIRKYMYIWYRARGIVSCFSNLKNYNDRLHRAKPKFGGTVELLLVEKIKGNLLYYHWIIINPSQMHFYSHISTYFPSILVSEQFSSVSIYFCHIFHTLFTHYSVSIIHSSTLTVFPLPVFQQFCMEQRLTEAEHNFHSTKLDFHSMSKII